MGEGGQERLVPRDGDRGACAPRPDSKRSRWEGGLRSRGGGKISMKEGKDAMRVRGGISKETSVRPPETDKCWARRSCTVCAARTAARTSTRRRSTSNRSTWWTDASKRTPHAGRGTRLARDGKGCVGSDGSITYQRQCTNHSEKITHKTYRMNKIDPLDPRIVGTLLSPPWLLAGTEVLFFPFQQGDLVIFADFHVSQGK